MLSYNIRDLNHQAATVDGQLAADDPVWLEGDPRPVGAIHVTGRLSSAGVDRYYWNGRLVGEAATECRRCLTAVVVPVDETVNAIFVEADDEVADDPDTYRLPPRATMLDLRPVVRELWLLGVPKFALCREDCRGLCPSCGIDRNTGDCRCQPETDRRWNALRQLRTATE
jgi:uncharacterized protein